MLVLSRKVGESIVIGDNIVVTVTAIRDDKVRLGIAAPKEVSVDRDEVRRAKGLCENKGDSGDDENS